MRYVLWIGKRKKSLSAHLSGSNLGPAEKEKGRLQFIPSPFSAEGEGGLHPTNTILAQDTPSWYLVS